MMLATASGATGGAANGLEDRVTCASPTPRKKGFTRIPRWKYEALRRAIHRVVVSTGRRGATLDELIEEAPRFLSEDERAELGSVSWHVNTVKLDLEVKGELAPLDGATPQRHVRVLRDAA
jgi:hypothetical protein